ncbi:PilZ domain-containing protein [Mangrovicella endophytica]|uniref:PilZ domain-containing protein n=1 Tax=Mangrovicella endophytica TaxID=2066697 RepID=UPI0018E4103C|nr:PilZ domain-containing protein [Mangrovicella endophytica]
MMSALQELDPAGAERRVAPRTRTLKRAKILFNNHYSTFDCVVRNISATGALLTIDEAAHLPKVFEVRIGEDKDARPARLVYRRGMFAGIHFMDVASDENHMPVVPSAAGETMTMVAEAHDVDVRRIVPEPLPAAIVRNLRWR